MYEVYVLCNYIDELCFRPLSNFITLYEVLIRLHNFVLCPYQIANIVRGPY